MSFTLPASARLATGNARETLSLSTLIERKEVPAKGWRTAWRSLRSKAARNDEGEIIYAALDGLRFHDLRHTAVTVMAEAGLPDATIMAQVGHVSPQMLKTYSHVRRLALNAAAAALEPTYIKPQIHAELVN